MDTVNERIMRVRDMMERRGLDAFLVLTEDPHGSEYPATYWKFREFLSGFNGSAGVLLITKQHVGLWTDSRYYLQAEKQLRGTSIELFKQGTPGVPDYVSYLTYVLPSGSVVGVDGFTLSYSKYKEMRKALDPFDIRIKFKVDIHEDVFVPREALPTDEVTEMLPDVAGLTRLEKVAQVRDMMIKNNVTHYIVSALDDIAWLTNLRGTDVEYNPVFYAYMIITHDEEHLYINPHKLTSTISRRLDEDGIKVSLYDHFEKNLGNLSEGSVVYYDNQRASVRNIYALPDNVKKIGGNSLIGKLKGCKSAVEIKHINSAHERDGVAMVRFLYWLTRAMELNTRLTEMDIAEELLSFRKDQPYFMGESFGTISAYGSNAAIVHYSPTIETNKIVEPKGFLLLDSGGQYVDGTTDLTRTIAMGDLTEQQCRDYTLVLKGHIALATQQFPEGTRGVQLDTLARMAMWQEGIDYGHGTGHGVGYFLSVHEGPQRIAKVDNGNAFEEGMLTSNEPGIYRAGRYGIRIENLMMCEKAEESYFGKFLKFRSVTLCPIDTKPIVVEMLTDKELAWLNSYHEKVRTVIMPYLEHYPEEQAWLAEATTALVRG
jgi:Xaa-Pro aminopeptidase